MSGLAGKRILVVEDEPIIAFFVEDMLMELGATVVGPAYTIAQGLHLAVSGEIDAAILDVNVRDESIGPVRDELIRNGIPLVFATGYGQDSARDVTDGYVVINKPYSKERVERALSECLSI